MVWVGGWGCLEPNFPANTEEQLYHIEASSREEVNFNHHCQKHNLLLLPLRLSHVLLFCNPMDCSLPGSSVHGVSQARILEWVAISFSRDLPDPGIPCLLHWQVDSLPLSHQGSPLCNRLYTKSGQDQSGFFQCSMQINNKAHHFLPCLKYL